MDINTVTDVTEKAYNGNLKEYDTYYAGLFGITKNAVIKDLNIKGAYVNISENEDGSRNKSILAAILAGYMDNTTITGCKVEVMYPSNQQQLCGELRVLQALVTEI